MHRLVSSAAAHLGLITSARRTIPFSVPWEGFYCEKILAPLMGALQ